MLRCRRQIHACTRPIAHERTRASACAHLLPSAGPWRRAWRSGSTRSTCSSTTFSTSSSTPTSTFSQHHAAGGLGDNPRHRQRRQQDGQRRQREQPPAELRLATCLLVQPCTGCNRAACVCSTACRRVSGAAQRAAREPYHMQTHATSQLHRARAVHVPLIAVVCVMGCCICMLVCGMSCHMPTSLSQLYACLWWLHSYACLWYVMSHAYLAIAVVCLFVVCHVTCTCTCHMNTTLG